MCLVRKEKSCGYPLRFLRFRCQTGNVTAIVNQGLIVSLAFFVVDKILIAYVLKAFHTKQWNSHMRSVYKFLTGKRNAAFVGEITKANRTMAAVGAKR